MKKLSIYVSVIFCFAILLQGCGIKTNKELKGLIENSIANCDYGDDKGYKHSYGWQIQNCKDNEIKKASEWVAKNPLSEVLPTLAVYMNDENDKKASTGVYLMNRVLWDRAVGPVGFNELADNPALIDDKTAKHFIESVKKYGNENWFQYATAAVTHIAVIKGVDTELLALADTAKPESRLKKDVYVNLLKYGRDKHFDRIKELGKSSNPQDILLSIGAAENFRDDRNISDGHLSAYCSFVQEYLGYEKDFVASQAGAGLSRLCKGDFIDKSLDNIEKRIKESGGKKIDGQFKYSLTYITCPPSGRITEEQCKRKDDLLKKFDALK